MAKVIDVKISEIRTSFYVREKLDQNYVLYLMELLEGGKILPPIILYPDYELCEGRNRLEAHKGLVDMGFLRFETIKAIRTT